MLAHLRVDPSAITNEVIAGLIVTTIVGVFVWFGRRILRWLTSLNRHWSLRWLHHELSSYQRLQADRGAVLRFLAWQAVLMLTLVGVLLMFAPLAGTPKGVGIFDTVLLIIGSVIYVLGIYALSTVFRAEHKPEEMIKKLQDRIRELESPSSHGAHG